MKRLKRNKLLSSLVGLSVLVVVIAFPKSANSQDKKPALPSEQKNSEAASKPKQLAAGSWTCSMHPQIHQAGRGKCPICGMHLIVLRSHGADSLMSLDGMLSLALQHNPGVRAVQAKVIAAEAELDQTRLEVVQKIIAYRQRWRAQQAHVSSAAIELEEAQQSLSRLSRLSGPNVVAGNLVQRAESLVRSARTQLPLEQARLKEIEAELPFLLGRQEAPQAGAAAGSKAAIIRDRLIPKIEQLIKVAVKEYQTGNASLSGVLPWSKRLAELKLRTATTKAERLAAVRSHIEWAKSIAKMTGALYRAAEVSQVEVLAAEIRLAEAELWLTEVGESSR